MTGEGEPPSSLYPRWLSRLAWVSPLLIPRPAAQQSARRGLLGPSGPALADRRLVTDTRRPMYSLKKSAYFRQLQLAEWRGGWGDAVIIPPNPY